MKWELEMRVLPVRGHGRGGDGPRGTAPALVLDAGYPSGPLHFGFELAGETLGVVGVTDGGHFHYEALGLEGAQP